MPKKRLTIEIDEQLKKDLKIKVAKQETTLKEVIERLIRDFLLTAE